MKFSPQSSAAGTARSASLQIDPAKLLPERRSAEANDRQLQTRIAERPIFHLFCNFLARHNG